MDAVKIGQLVVKWFVEGNDVIDLMIGTACAFVCIVTRF
jgi:hypothetical protein